MPVPQSAYPAPTLNWHILCSDLYTPPPASRLPGNLWTSKRPPRWRPQGTLARLIEAHKICFLLGLLLFFFPLFQRLTFSAGISTVSLMARDPWRTVPVMTVPWPRMEKQWSTAISRSPPGSLWGRYVCFFKSWNGNDNKEETEAWTVPPASGTHHHTESWSVTLQCGRTAGGFKRHLHRTQRCKVFSPLALTQRGTIKDV